MQDTGCLGLVHWDDPEGWYREGGGRRVQDGEYVYTHDELFWVRDLISRQAVMNYFRVRVW